MGDGAGQLHRPAPLRLDDQREIDLARVRARRLIFATVPPTDPRARELYRAFVRDEVLVPLGIPVDEEALAKEAPPPDLVPPGGELLLAMLDGAPAAIGGVRDLDTEVAEIKSLYVVPSARGRGIARRLMGRLHEIAAQHGCRSVRLDTAHHLTASIALYRSLGYREIPAYNDGPNADLWFELELDRD